MAPLCICTGLVGPVPKGTWQISWTNRRCGWNLGSLIWTNQMNGGILVLLVQRKCTLHNVLWKWHRWGNTALLCTSKTDGNAAFLQQHLHPALRRKCQYLVVQNTIILDNNHTAAVTDLLCRWQCEILEHPPYPRDMSDLVQHKRWTYPCYRAVNTELQQRWTCWWCTLPSKHLTKGDK